MGRTRKAAESSDTKDLDAKSKAIEKSKARMSREKAQKSYREASDSEQSEKEEVGKFAADPKDKDFSEDEVSVSEASESDYGAESSGSEYGKRKKTSSKIAKAGKGRGKKGGKKAAAATPKGRGRGRGRTAAASASKNGSKRAPAKRKADSDESESEAESSGSEYGKKASPAKKRGPPAARASPKRKKAAAASSPASEGNNRARRGRPAAKAKSYKEVSEDEELEVSEEEKKPVSKRAKLDSPKNTKVEKKKKEESESEEDVSASDEEKDEKDEKREKPEDKFDKIKKNGTSEKKVEEKDSEDEDKESKKADDDEESEEEEKKEKEKSSGSEEEKVVGLKNRTDTDYSKIDFECDKKTPDGDAWNYKISCWNIGGIKSWLKKNGLEYLKKENPDVMCLNEIKCNEKTKPEELSTIEGYPHTYWSYNTENSGHSGVAVLSKTEGKNVQYGFPVEESDSAEDKKAKENFNKEGRLITVEYENHYLINAYVPNSGRSEKSDEFPKGYPLKVASGERINFDKFFKDFVKALTEKKPVIVTGDLNVAHQEIDLANPKTNERNAGFTKEEREDLTKMLEELNLIDSFRTLYPEKKAAYSFWSYKFNSREKNVGWRLDYFLVSDKLRESLCENLMRTEVYGSDHCPIVLFIKN